MDAGFFGGETDQKVLLMDLREPNANGAGQTAEFTWPTRHSTGAVTGAWNRGNLRITLAKKSFYFSRISSLFGGGGEIRTHEGRKPLPVFKTGAFNRSATPPKHPIE